MTAGVFLAGGQVNWVLAIGGTVGGYGVRVGRAGRGVGVGSGVSVGVASLIGLGTAGSVDVGRARAIVAVATMLVVVRGVGVRCAPICCSIVVRVSCMTLVKRSKPT